MAASRILVGRVMDCIRSRFSLIAALCLVVTVSYGALYYGFAMLITGPAAGADFSPGLLSAAYGGAVVTGGVTAVRVGRVADGRACTGSWPLAR